MGRSCSPPRRCRGWRRSARASNRGCGWKRTGRASRSPRWGGCILCSSSRRLSSPLRGEDKIAAALLGQHRDGAGLADEDEVAGAVVLEHLDAVLLGVLELLAGLA